MMAVPMGLAFDSIYLCHHYVKSIPSVAVRLGHSLSDSQAGQCLSWFAGQAIPPSTCKIVVSQPQVVSE